MAVGSVSATGRSDLGIATNKGNLAHAGDSLPLDLVFVDTIAGELSGRVFLPSGTPAGAGVEVTVNGPLPDVTVSTDADSHFVFARVLPQGNYSITARDSVTGGVVRESVYLRAGQDLQHDLRLLGRGTVRVKVVDALGAAVDRAFVTLREQQYPQRRHDRSIEPTLLGVATFEDVFEGPFSVEVRDLVGRGGRGSGAVPAPDSSVDVSVSLNPTGSVKGTFLMPDRETRIPYALVTLLVNGRAVGQTTTPGTGPQIGEFSFDFVPAGPVRVEAEDPLTLRTGFAVGVLEAESVTPLDLTVIAKGLGTVKGQVFARLAGGGEELRPGASVKLESGNYRGSTLADAEAKYEFGGVPEGALTVTASIGAQALSGSASGSITTDGQVLPLDVYLRDAGSVSGHVLRADGETPVPPSKVTIHAGGTGGGSQVTYTRDAGAFSFAQVATGRATIEVEELGGPDRGRGAVDVLLGANQAEVVMNGVGSLLVKARDASGDAVAGDVWLSSSGAFPWQAFVRVPASGEFRLPELLAGPVTAKLRAQPGEATLWGTGTGDVAADQEKELVVTLAPSGSVTGRILRAHSLVRAYGADVKLLLSGGNGQVSVQADENGAFVATGIPLVAFDLRASDAVSGGVAVLRDRQLAANGATLDLGEIVLDDTAPLIQILAPVEGQTRPGYLGELVIELSDEGAGLDLDSLVARYPRGLPVGRDSFTFTGNRASLPLDPDALVSGLNVVRVSVKDLAGRLGEAEVSFRILGGTIRGHVQLPGGGHAVGRPVGVYGASVVTDTQGNFAIEGLRAGNYYVTATDPDSGLSTQSLVALADGGEQSVELQLPAFMRLQGSVVLGGGGEVRAQGIQVWAVGEGGFYRQDTTGADGVFDLGALPLGSYTLEARRVNRLRGRVEDVLLDTPGGLRDVPITLVVTGTVHGVVTGSSGPAAGANVGLRSLADPWGGYFSARTGTGGEYEITDVPAGPFTISASKAGDQVDETGEMPAAGGSLLRNLELRRSAVELPLQLGDAGGTFWSLRKNGALVTSGTRRVYMAEAATPRLTLVRDGVPAVFTGPDCPDGVACTVGSEEGQREIVLTADDVAGLAVVRKVYVPTDGYFVRILDLVRNDGAGDVTVDLLEESEVSSSSVRSSSSGDALAQASDRWLVLDDSDSRDIFELSFPSNSFAPTAFVAWGAGGTGPTELAAAFQSGIDRTRVSQRWSAVPIRPGETVGILQLVAIQSDQARARASAERLVQLPPEALAGLELDEADAILNFHVPADLTSALPALPSNDGVVDGSVLGGDRETPISLATARFRSRSPYYGRPLTASPGPLGTYLLQGRPDQGSVVPRGDLFDMRATKANGFGTFTATAAGRFVPESGVPASRATVVVAFSGTGVVSGFVRRADHSVVPSAQVTLRAAGAFESQYVGASGGFTFAPVPANTATLYAYHPLGFSSVSTPGFALPGPCSTTADGLRCERVEKDLVFPAFGAIEGHVSAGPDPVLADLELVATGFRRFQTTHPVTGAYRFDDVPPGPYTVVARGRSVTGSVAAQVSVVADAVSPLELALETPTRLTGTLHGGALRPVPWQTVSVIGPSGGEVARATSGFDGTFVIDHLPKGSFVLRGEAADSFLRSRFDVPLVLADDEQTADAFIPVGILAPGESHLFELTAPAGRPLTFVGSSWSPGEAPLASFDLYVFGPDGQLAGSAATSSGFARVDIASSEAGRYVVAIHSAASTAGLYRVASPLFDDVHVFRPLAGGLVELAVTRGVVPLAGQAVTVENERVDLPPDERHRNGVTGAGGLFRAVLPEGPILARAVDPATSVTHEARGTLASGGTLPLAIPLPALPSTVRGTVTNGDGLVGLPYALVTLSGSLYTYTDANGVFRFDDVPPDTYTLTADYYPGHVEEILDTSGGEYVRELRVPIPVVRGQVQEPGDGSAVPGALVELCFAEGCAQTPADASGWFAFYGQTGTAPASLRARFPDLSTLASSPVPIPWTADFTGTVTQSVVMPETARLVGTVSDPDGNAVTSAQVSVYADDAGPSSTLLSQATTDANGLYRMRFATGGAIRVYATSWWFAGPGQRRGTLTVGEELALDIQLAASGTLDVAIVNELGYAQCGHAMVQAIEQPGADGGVWSQFLNLCPEGPTNQILDVPIGAYRVFSLDSETPGAVEGELARGEVHEVHFREGTHVRLPLPLRGDEALFVGDGPCPPPCSGFAATRLEGAEDYPPVASQEAGGRGLRSLRVAGSGVHVRRLQYTPHSGSFGRTLTVVTNRSGDAVSVPLDTLLKLDAEAGSVATPGGGPLDSSQPWAVVQHATGVQGLVLGGALTPESFGLASGPEVEPALEARHSLTLDPDDTQALLTYTLVGTGSDTAPLEARAAALAALSEPGALFGLTNEDRAAIVNFSVPPAGDLRVSVLWESSGVEGARVGVLDGSDALVAEATTAAGGTVLFAGLPPGTYTAVAVDAAGRPGRAVVDVAAGTTAAETAEAVVTLLADDALGAVGVEASWIGSGDPAAGVRVALEAAGWSPVWRPVAETDENGLVILGQVPLGPVIVRAEPASVGAAVPADVSAGVVTPAPLTIEPFATLQGLVTVGDGSTTAANLPVAAIDVATDAVLATALTDEFGWYRLAGVRPGPGGVRVRAASPYDAAVTVASEVLTPAVPGFYGVDPLVLPVGVIVGRVDRASGSVRHPVVLARDSSGRSILAEWTDEYGNFRIVGAVAGQVTVTVIDIENGERASQTLELDIATPQWLFFFLGPAPV